MKNLDNQTADGFDRIWKRYDEVERNFPDDHSDEAFRTYFSIFPLERLAGAEGFDLGCGNGRIARWVAPRAGLLHCIDQSPSGLAAAERVMEGQSNARFHRASVDAIPLADGSQDFGYSIGVLHHIPDPEAGLRSCVAKLKVGAPFLVYLYYSLDNRPGWFRAVWRASDVARRLISKLPFGPRRAASDLIAAAAYWPLSRIGGIAQRLGVPTGQIPLSSYIGRPWADLRADSLDRFGTAVEHRFSRPQVEAMMIRCGLENIRFADGPPFWIAVGTKR